MKPAESYILRQSEPFKSILLHLQILIERTFSKLMLQFKWKIPFYYMNNKPFCYLNVSEKKGFIDVGFWISVPLNKYNKFLISENRKVIKSLRYSNLEDINEEVLLSVLKKFYATKG